MAKIIAVHSFRRGTGKSTLAANVATLLMHEGYRVGLIDLNFPSPSQHVLFGLDKKVRYTINHCIWGDCDVEEAVYDVTSLVTQQRPNGRLFLMPASDKPKQIGRMLQGGYYVHLLVDIYQDVAEQFELDILLIDTYAGINDEMKMAALVSDEFVVVVRPDNQDFDGTGVVLGVCQALQVPQTWLVVNEVPPFYDAIEVQKKMEKAFSCSVAAVVPHNEQLMLVGSNGIFAEQYPEHFMSLIFRRFARHLLKT